MNHPRIAVVVSAVLIAVAGVVVWQSFSGSDAAESLGPTSVTIRSLALDGPVEPGDVDAGDVGAGDVVDDGSVDTDETDSASAPDRTGDDRPVVDASELEGLVVLDQPDTIYDFGDVVAERDITIAASNTEARNIRGSGARRIGQRDGNDYVDSGFRDFEFTYMQTQNGGGGKLIRPYFIDGTDINEDDRVAEGSPVHIYAYEGDIIEPLLEGITVRGWLVPEGSEAHNDAIHLTGITGGRVYDPTIRDSSVTSGAAIGLLTRHTYGLVTIEGSTFEGRYGSFHAVLGNSEDVEEMVTILWRDNTLVGSSTASFINGYLLDARREVGDDAVVVQSE